MKLMKNENSSFDVSNPFLKPVVVTKIDPSERRCKPYEIEIFLTFEAYD